MAVVMMGVILVATVPASAETITDVSDAAGVLSEDLQVISDSATDYDLESLFDACVTLSYDASKFVDYSRPSGYPRSAWKPWKRSLKMFGRAGDACAEGASSADSTLIDESIQWVQRGTIYVNRAIRRLSEDG